MIERRRLARLGLVGLLGAAGLAACSDEPDRLEEAQDGIAAALADRLDEPVDDVVVTCPDDALLEDGSDLTCEVAVGDADPQPVPFTIAEGGSVRPASAVIPTPAIVAHLESELATPAEGAVEVDCGDAPLVVKDVDDTITCDVVRTADGVAFTVEVAIRSLDGSITYTVATTSTTSTSTTLPVDPSATTATTVAG